MKKQRNRASKAVSRSVLRRYVTVSMLILVLGLGWAVWWLNAPMRMSQPLIDLQINKGASARAIAQQVQQSGVDVAPSLLFYWFKISGKSRQIHAGSYQLETGLTPVLLLKKLVNGDVAMRSVTLIEGWNIGQVRAALRNAPQLIPSSQGMTNAELMQALGLPSVHPEGQFFPDTYHYAKGSTDLALLAQAQQAMTQQLAAAWAARSPNASARNPNEALILASIIEKETGLGADRAMVSAVFNNRLRLGMRLQTDPTVIYGIGPKFNGNLKKVHLLTDTPYNSYTRVGLPPTPIAMPSKAALHAALHPAPSKALYFVAKGDGSSQFSETLTGHNRAVRQYILAK